jgi:hypothetical protein
VLGEDDWDLIRTDWAARANDPSGPAFRLLGGLLDLRSRLTELEEKVTETFEGAVAGRREAALRTAREIANGLPSEQPNARGYRDHALNPRERISMELDIARYLLGGGS